MSVFRVYRGNSDDLAEFRGTRVAGAAFANVFRNSAPHGRNIFEDLVTELIDRGCRVTYNPSTDPDGDEYPVSYERHRHRKIIYYTMDGDEFSLRLRSEQDDPTDNKVSMAVPSRPVEYTDEYLARAVDVFKRTDIDDDDKQKFLLGMLLLKRCR